jgi:hypothetical protein
MKPLGGHPIEPGCEINWSSHLAAGLVALIMPMDGHGKSFVNMVTGQRAETTRGTVAYTPSHWGLCAGNGGGGLRMPIFDIHCYEPGASITLFGTMPPTWSPWERLASIGESPTARLLDVIAKGSAGDLNIYADGRVGATAPYTPSVKSVEGTPIRVTASLAKGTGSIALNVNGATTSAALSDPNLTLTCRKFVPGGILETDAGNVCWRLMLATGCGSPAVDAPWMDHKGAVLQ